MQSRRWWYTVAITLLLTGLASPSLAAPAAPAAPAAIPGINDVDDWVKKMVSSKDSSDCKNTADGILLGLDATKSGPDSIPKFDKFAGTIADSVNNRILKPATGIAPYVTVNGISLLVESQIRVDALGIPLQPRVLSDRLAHANPVVRYWAAKGMVVILSKKNANQRAALAKVWGPALKAAVATETSAPARTLMFRALGSLGDVRAVNDPLAKVVAVFRAKTPTAADAAAIAADLDSLAEALRNGNPNPLDTTAAVTTAANAASFIAQHAANVELAAKDKDASAKLQLDAKQLQAAALEVGNAAIRSINAAAKATAFGPVKADSAAILQIAIDEWTNPRNTTSALQKIFPAVPYPPRIGEAAAPRTPAPATAAKGK